jgi:predicted  nucleic acid-binding Zn-ribbon protein
VSVVRQLYQLQLVDSEWDEKQQRLAAIDQSLGDDREVVRAQEAVAETEAALDKLRAQLRALELEVSGLNDKLKKNQERLYGGKVRNPKELSGLQEEATALRRRRSELEDEQLTLMIGVEEQEAELAERQARLRQIESSWRTEQALLATEKDDLELRLAELEDQRAAIRDRLGARDLADYDDLRQRFGGVAVVVLRRGICQTCGVDVPTSVARAVERGEGIHYCPVCNRLLVAG